MSETFSVAQEIEALEHAMGVLVGQLGAVRRMKRHALRADNAAGIAECMARESIIEGRIAVLRALVVERHEAER